MRRTLNNTKTQVKKHDIEQNELFLNKQKIIEQIF